MKYLEELNKHYKYMNIWNFIISEFNVELSKVVIRLAKNKIDYSKVIYVNSLIRPKNMLDDYTYVWNR